MAQTTNRIRQEEDAYRGSESMMNRAYETAECAVQEHPVSAALTVFAIGLGLGAIIGCALAEPFGLRRSSTARTAEGLSHRVLDAIGDYLPDSVRRQLHV